MNQPTRKLLPAEPQAPPPARASRKPLLPKQQAYLQKLWANRQKAGSFAEVQQAVRVDEAVRGRSSGFRSATGSRMRTCGSASRRKRASWRSPCVLEGQVEWWGCYDIKLKLATGRSVVVFRHEVWREGQEG